MNDCRKLRSIFVYKRGGIYKNEFFVHGRISTISNSLKSKELLKHFSQAIKKEFRCIKGWYIGEEACVLLKNGMRFITISTLSPPEYDLRIDDNVPL